MIEHKLLISFPVFCIKLVDFGASDNLYSILWRKTKGRAHTWNFGHEAIGISIGISHSFSALIVWLFGMKDSKIVFLIIKPSQSIDDKQQENKLKKRKPRGIEIVQLIEKLAKRWLSNYLLGSEGQSLGPDAFHLQWGWRKNLLAVKAVKQNTLLWRSWNYLWALVHFGFKQHSSPCLRGLR